MLFWNVSKISKGKIKYHSAKKQKSMAFYLEPGIRKQFSSFPTTHQNVKVVHSWKLTFRYVLFVYLQLW